MNDLEKLFMSELKDIYDGEFQLVDALPEMASYADSADLKSCFNQHFEQTKGHINRLESVFSAFGEEPSRKTCQGMEGIIEENKLLCAEFKGNTALDAALVACAQKAEHYEIATYGTLCTWAKELGNDRVLALLKSNYSEEKNTDEVLTDIATSFCNLEAIRHNTEITTETAKTETFVGAM